MDLTRLQLPYKSSYTCLPHREVRSLPFLRTQPTFFASLGDLSHKQVISHTPHLLMSKMLKFLIIYKNDTNRKLVLEQITQSYLLSYFGGRCKTDVIRWPHLDSMYAIDKIHYLLWFYAMRLGLGNKT